MTTISVAIPVRIVDLEQYTALLKCLDSVYSQTVRPLNIVVSIDGFSEELSEDLRNKYKFDNLDIIKNPETPGIASNSNNAIKFCKGELIHVLHQDDEIKSNDCYEKVIEKFEYERFKWLLLGGETSTGGRVEPVYDSYTKFGINKIGGPSGLIAPRQDHLYFNPAYSMMTDVANFESYHRRYGEPSVLPQPWISYGDLNSSASRNIPRNMVIQEIRMMRSEFCVPLEEVISFIANPKLNLIYRKIVFDSFRSSISHSQRVTFLTSFGVLRILNKVNLIGKRHPLSRFKDWF